MRIKNTIIWCLIAMAVICGVMAALSFWFIIVAMFVGPPGAVMTWASILGINVVGSVCASVAVAVLS